MRITTTRIISQTIFFLLFIGLVFTTQFTLLKGYPVSWFLQLSPLVALSTTFSTYALYDGLLWSLIVIIPTLFIGRFFCGWICPYGTLHHFIGWLARPAKVTQRTQKNQYLPWQNTKYYLLIVLLILSAIGTVQIGLLDPLCLFYRSTIVCVFPVMDWLSGNRLEITPRVYTGSYLIGSLLLFFLAANLIIPRFFCRIICPLGALMGLLSRFAILRVFRNPHTCTNCTLCRQACEGACAPDAEFYRAECLVCFNCIEDCPHGALSFTPAPTGNGEHINPELTRRQLLTSAVVGVTAFPLLRRSGELTPNFSPQVIRPPGSVEEKLFLERCVKCGQCMRVCPTNVLQPSFWQAGMEGLWTPVLNMRIGRCEENCTLCGQVCPTGAIQPLSIAQRQGTGEYQDQGPIRIGTAFYDRGRCLPWAMGKPCVVCEEVCPVSPKAIFTRPHTFTNHDGTTITLDVPFVDMDRCIGCGACEHDCPVADRRAIRVTAAGETRSEDRALSLAHRHIIPRPR